MSTVFEAVSKIDQSKSMDDYVEFSAIPQTIEDKLNNLYRVNVKVTNYSENLLIRPKCETLPAIEKILTNINAGAVPASTPVMVKFSTEMNGSQLDFETIHLSYNGIDLKEYFYTPVMNEEKNILIIQTKGKDFQRYITNSLKRDFVDVKVSFDDSISIIKEGVSVPLKQNDLSSFTVVYNTQLDDTPPVKMNNRCFVTGKEINLNNADELEEQFYCVENPEDNNIKLYRAKQNIYVCGHYNDPESGISKITVYTQREYLNDYNELCYEKKSKEYYVDTSVPYYRVNEAGNTDFCIPHEINGKDGTYSIRYVVENACGLYATESPTVKFYKETSLSGNLIVRNVDSNSFDSPEVFNRNLYKLKIPKIAGYDDYDEDYDYGVNIYGADKIKYEFGEFPLYITYVAKDGKERTERFQLNTDIPDRPYYYYDLQVNTADIPGCTFTISGENDIGNEFVHTYTIPSEPFIVDWEWYNGWPTCTSITGDQYYVPYWYDENNNFTEVPTRKGERIWYQSGKDYYITMGTNLQGPLKLINDDTAVGVVDAEIQLDSIEYEPAEDDPREFYVTLKVNPDEWEKYNEIYITNYRYFSGRKYFDKKTNSLKYRTECYLFRFSDDIYMYALDKNGNLIINSVEIGPLDVQQSKKVDKILPYIKISKNEEAYVFRIWEDETEIESASVEFANKSLSGFSWNIISPNPDDEINPENGGSTSDNKLKSSYLKLIKRYIFKSEYGWRCYVPFLELTVPVWMIHGGGDRLLIKAKDTAGNEFEDYFSLDLTIYGKVVSHFNNKDNGFSMYKAENYTNGPWPKFKIQKWNNGWGNDLFANEYNYSSDNRSCEFGFSRVISNSGFYRVYSEVSSDNKADYYFEPHIYYMPSSVSSHTGFYDYLISNPGNNKSVLVMSDAPVFVCTYSISCPYSEVINWTIEEWEHYTLTTNETVMSNFSSSKHELTAHPTEDPNNPVPEGHCFVVVAYFADGSKAKSDVFTK